MKQTLFCLLLLNFSLYAIAQKNYVVKSPDERVQVIVSVDKEQVKYQILHEGDVIIRPSTIAMQLSNGKGFGIRPTVRSTKSYNIKQQISSPIYKRSQIEDYYNEMEIKFKGDYLLLFRAYNEGAAYRFVSTGKKEFTVANEIAEFNLGSNYPAYIPYVKIGKTFEQQFFNSFENTYTYTPISQWESQKLAFLPILMEGVNGKKIAITEADLEHYPGMFLCNEDASNTLKGVFAPYPKTVEQGSGYNNLQGVIKEREPYIAKSSGPQQFPWRVVIVSTKDRELLDNDLVYKLAAPSRIEDVAWIKPGKVAWDWWNNWNIYGVDFKSGINNETYQYYIDFASANHIEYVILDEGWAVNKKADLMQVVPEIDLVALTKYARSKQVGLILWAGYHAFNRDMENVCRHYADMGIKGFKIDFMNRDDQEMVDFYYKSAAVAAKYKLLVDFHGAYKPTGLQRTYPNVMNFEGVNGLEQLKWDKDVDQVTYDVTIPFIRQLAGPMDYTQGAMHNAIKREYAPVYANPMSQGTRCRQLATYIIFESPLNMLCDNPSNYMKEQECTDFIAAVPTVWDETVVLNGKIAQYTVIARKKDATWYVGALTNWDKRALELDLDFLGAGNYRAEIFKDGVNANKVGMDYKREIIDVPANKRLTISMAPGGGFVARIIKN
ncbi:MAG: glycoside hydrolase family 97 protein [Dysgonamonadaceae bacterium]|nr:glycoside hydrolase family 97 protein [Dysgonamonadaceae bacterium]